MLRIAYEFLWTQLGFRELLIQEKAFSKIRKMSKNGLIVKKKIKSETVR